jgi:hypothetical protein
MASEITHFNTFIAQRSNGIPYSTQWMVHFDIPSSLSVDLGDIDTEIWNISRSQMDVIRAVQGSTNKLQGNALVQSVTTPGEKIDIHRVGIESDFRGGFNQTPIVKSRNDNELISVNFLETRNSFVDLVIRPWIILVGSQGLVPISDDPNDSIKTTLWAVFFDRGDAENQREPVIRKKWVFHNAVPVSCDADTVDYQKNQITTLKTQWLYSHYTIEVPETISSGASVPSSVTTTATTAAPTLTPGSKIPSSKPNVAAQKNTGSLLDNANIKYKENKTVYSKKYPTVGW